MIIEPIINQSLTAKKVDIITSTIKRYADSLTDKLHRCNIWCSLESIGINHNPIDNKDMYCCFYFTLTYHFSYGIYNCVDREYITKYITTTDLSEIQAYIKKDILHI